MVHHLQTVFGDFITNKSFLLWSQKLLSIYDFQIEKIPGGMMGHFWGPADALWPNLADIGSVTKSGWG